MKRMDQARTAGAAEQPSVVGGEPAKRTVSGDAATAAAAAAGGGCFDCNICLDCAAEPVVTLCGHLYCWPCIYEWLRPGAGAGADARSSARRQCPVCKAAVSAEALVPLYGRGGDSSSRSRSEKPPCGPATATIPRRPAVRRGAQDGGSGGHRHWNDEADAPTRQPRHHADAAPFPPPFVDRGMMTHSTAGGMAVAVLPWAWVLRGHEQVQPPSLYYLSPRQRRLHMEVERSLHQIWFFLFVFVLLCFLLF